MKNRAGDLLVESFRPVLVSIQSRPASFMAVASNLRLLLQAAAVGIINCCLGQPPLLQRLLDQSNEFLR